MSQAKIVITHWVHPEVIALFNGKARVIANSGRDSWSQQVLLEHCRDADALMAFMPDSIGEDFLQQCPALRLVAAALKGYDNFDVAACTERGIWFSIVPDLLTVPTAELTIGLMIALARRLREGDQQVRSGMFQGWRPQLYGTGLAGKTAGLIGFGAVGKAIARRLRAFDMQVIFSDPGYVPGVDVEQCQCVPLSQLLASADYLIPMVPLTADTLHLINADSLRQCKDGAMLVNTGRGSAVDEQAVIRALASGKLGGYAADVYEMEDWARPDRPATVPDALRSSPNTLFTPHLGSAVDDVRRDIALAAAHNILDLLAGQHPRDAINQPRLRSLPVS
jgi:phosphonate dehydrogenase